ncbi:MAG: hypothetical protein FD147_78 [Chloroflexi bacterium]|nr:MAG: hypothetical protein FD147_78 [Chloroflexota bacterium]MBA4374705.1 hypothetical protein [Anaerolinea sp.]
MGSTCIITDNAAQFTKLNFPENICLRFINYKSIYGLSGTKDKTKPNLSTFPRQLTLDQKPIITLPSFSEIYDLITSSLSTFDDVFIILHSKELSPVYEIVANMISKMHGRASVHLIDSQSISTGQGHLIQFASDLIINNIPGADIEQKLREEVPHIYTLLCATNLSYLHTSGFIDIGQCIVGEMVSLLPIFGIEGGKLNPLEKVKNTHSVVDYFIEFIDEFDDLFQLSFLQPAPPLLSEAKIIKQYIEENYSNTTYTEHPLNSYLVSLIGPKGFGIVVLEKS